MALPKLFQRIFWHNNTTPAINEDNLNAMSKGLSDVDDRLIELAGTIMEDVPEIQHDLEILEPAIENIDANVERSETAADNAETEALKSEGYAIGTQDGVEVTSGEYYQKNAKYYAEIANPPIENTVDFTDIITISDAINKAAKDVKVKVDAVQDLHGHSKPWVGGAGKNKIPMTVEGIKAANTSGTWNGNVYTIDTLIFTLQTKDNNVVGISVNGSRTSTYFFILGNIALGLSNGLNTWNAPTVGGYTVSSGTTGDSDSTYGVGWDNSNNNAYIAIRANTSVSNKVFYPQIEVGTSATAFEPYTNICPISGWDDAMVTRSGKNLLQNNATAQTTTGVTFVVNDDKRIVANGTASNLIFYTVLDTNNKNQYPLEEGKTYRFSGDSRNYNGYMVLQINEEIVATTENGDAIFVAPEFVSRMFVYLRIRQNAVLSNTVFEPMISVEVVNTNPTPPTFT